MYLRNLARLMRSEGLPDWAGETVMAVLVLWSVVDGAVVAVMTTQPMTGLVVALVSLAGGVALLPWSVGRLVLAVLTTLSLGGGVAVLGFLLLGPLSDFAALVVGADAAWAWWRLHQAMQKPGWY